MQKFSIYLCIRNAQEEQSPRPVGWNPPGLAELPGLERQASGVRRRPPEAGAPQEWFSTGEARGFVTSALAGWFTGLRELTTEVNQSNGCFLS